MRLDLWLVFALLAVALLRAYRRHGRAASAWRAGLLERVGPLLEECRRTEDRHGFPRLVGRRDGREVEIGLECDHTAVRAHPCLWLTVTLMGPLQVTGGVHLLTAVPGAAERMDEAGQAGWPAAVRVTTDMEPAALEWLRAPAARYFEDPGAKELVLTPNGLQLVYLLEQAHAGWQLLLPVLRFDIRAVHPDQVEQLLVHAFAVAAALEKKAVARVA